MFEFLFEPMFFIPYISLNFLLALYTYKQGKKFYEEKLITNKDEMTGRSITVNLHDLYPEFKRYDKLTFPRLFFGLVFIFWIKFLILLFGLFCIYLTLKIAFWNDTDKVISEKKRRIVTRTFGIICGIGFFFFGVIRREKKTRYPEIYKKYFGEDYESEFDQNYSLIISNHVSWVEIVYYLKTYTPGFISKESIRDFPLIGVIATKIECLFLDRTNIENRQYVAEQIRIRQESFMEGTVKAPLLVFPEGTITSGKHMLKFKRGAFQNLLPIKPILVKIDHNDNVSLSCGAIKFWIHLIYVLCFLYHDFTIEELPVISPTDYMFEHYSHLGSEKWQIYAEVAREIYCEAGGFQKSTKTFQDMLDYLSGINGVPISNT